MEGYSKILRVNLTNRTSTVEDIPEDWPRLYGGGRGFAAKLLYDGVPDKCDPFGEDNKVIFCAGVLAGTNINAISRWIVVTKSPLTDGYCRSSGGGTWAAYMKFAGYDCIVIEGKSEAPVFLGITEGRVEFHDAAKIWGMNITETQEAITEALGGGRNTSTVAIGPAGENKVLYAGTFCGRRSASRGGSGAVLGSKNLKGIGIVAKKNLSHVFDNEKIFELAKQQAGILSTSDEFKLHKEWGTTDGTYTRNTMGIFPTKNFRYGYLEGCEALTGVGFKKYRTGAAGCYVCGAICGKIHTVTEGLYKGAESEGPEYESHWAFTGPIGVANIEAAIMADMICDDYGLDSMSTGVTIGFAYELYEKGIITKEDTDGLELVYGNHEAMIELMHKIGRYEGFGKILALGSKRMAELYGHGSSDYAMHVKGMELGGYEPRGLKCTGYGYATSNIGGAHCAGALAWQEWGMPVPRPLDRFEDFNKEDVVVYNQNNCCVNEIGIICAFANEWRWTFPLYAAMLATATGVEQFLDRDFRSAMGDRIYNMERAFLLRQGTTAADDTLPKRIQTEPLHTMGMPGEGQIISHLPEVIQAYYKYRGWTTDGFPTNEKLESLNLDYIIPDMERVRSW